MTQFVNDYGLRNIVSKGLTNQGVHSNLMVGQMAMHNAHGTSNIGLGAVQAAGQNTNTAIGLMNLDSAELMELKQAAPVFDNTNGKRIIAVKFLDNEGAKSISRVGELNMINKGGKSDIQIAKAIAGGKGTVTEVGLLNLAEEEEPQPKKAKKDEKAKKPKKAEKDGKAKKDGKSKKAKRDDSDSPSPSPKKAKKQEKPKKKEKKPKKQDSDDDDDELFLNVGGMRNILLKELLAQGEGSKTNIGQMAMDNTKGQANISLGKTANLGKGSLVNIGLLNLAEQQQPAKKKQQPKKKPAKKDDDDELFINVGGVRNILLKELLAQGQGSKTNIGEMAMDNTKGKANISMGKTANLGKGALVNIGLLELAQQQPQKKQAKKDDDDVMFINKGGQRNIMLKDFLAQGVMSKSNIGEMAMDNTQGKANIQMGATKNLGKGALVNIGLMDLAQAQQQQRRQRSASPQPVFVNTKGTRDITLADMLNKGDASVFKVGEMVMNNAQGMSNIKIGKSMNTGKGSISEIGLLI